jgi:hypothetical protein
MNDSVRFRQSDAGQMCCYRANCLMGEGASATRFEAVNDHERFFRRFC